MSIDYLTRRKHRPWAAGGDGAASQLKEIEAVTDVSSQLDQEVRREIFTRASQIARSHVSDTTWQAFHRTAVLGESIESVAADLGASTGSVYIARSRVMKRLQNAVKSFDEKISSGVYLSRLVCTIGSENLPFDGCVLYSAHYRRMIRFLVRAGEVQVPSLPVAHLIRTSRRMGMAQTLLATINAGQSDKHMAPEGA